jgi:hypothetical protein
MYGKSISYISRAINIEPSVITYSTDVYIYVMEKMNHVSSILPLQWSPSSPWQWMAKRRQHLVSPPARPCRRTSHTLALLIGGHGCETLRVCSTLPSLVDQNSYTSETSLVVDATNTKLLPTRGTCTRETTPSVGFFTFFSTLTRQSTPLPFLPPPLTLVSGTGGAPLFVTRHCIRSRRCNCARHRHEPAASSFPPSSPSSSGFCLPESRHSALFHSTPAKD